MNTEYFNQALIVSIVIFCLHIAYRAIKWFIMEDEDD